MIAGDHKFPDARRDFMAFPSRAVDEIDMEVESLAADPLCDYPPAMRGHGQIRRVLELLDQLEAEGGAS